MMFDSGISASRLIDDLKNEVDIAVPVPGSVYLEWLTGLEQLLYSEFIQEQRRAHLTPIPPVWIPEDPPHKEEMYEVLLSNIKTGEMEAPVRYEDIYTVFADGLQLIQSTLTSGIVFTNTWYKLDERHMGYNPVEAPEKLEVVYFVRPRIKEGMGENLSDDPVWVPYEFLDLVRARLRGEAYKFANEDNLAAKWINDYNVLLQTFQNWLVRRKAQFGM